MNNYNVSTLSLVLSILFALGVLVLFVFGISSSIVGIANLAIFTIWVLMGFSILTLLIPAMGLGDDLTERFKSYPMWYIISVVVIGLCTTIAVVFHGMFFVGAVFALADLIQLHYMRRAIFT